MVALKTFRMYHTAKDFRWTKILPTPGNYALEKCSEKYFCPCSKSHHIDSCTISNMGQNSYEIKSSPVRARGEKGKTFLQVHGIKIRS